MNNLNTKGLDNYMHMQYFNIHTVINNCAVTSETGQTRRDPVNSVSC